MHQRPLWEGSNPQELKDWHPLSGDLIRFLDERKIGTIAAIGHSVGGIALLRAALAKPKRFSRLILLDPVLFPPYLIRLYRLAHHLHLTHKIHPLAASAKHRRRTFKSRDLLLRGYRNKPIFRYFSDNALQAYVEGITCPRSEGGFKLCYSPEWEVQIYLSGIWRDMDLWRNLPTLQVPLQILYGAETDSFFQKAGELISKKLPSAQIKSIPQSTHLLPLEQPQTVSNEIKQFLGEPNHE